MLKYVLKIGRKILGERRLREIIYYKNLLTIASLKTDYVKNQMKNPKTIPIIIINFNQLHYLKKLIDFLTKRKFQNIVIVDNASSYPPLLEYYKQIENNVTIERLNYNGGHNVFFENQDLINKYGRGFYFLTDPDITPNENLPKDFDKIMIRYLIKYFNKITKIGLALDISDIPDAFPLKNKVIAWEKRFWKKEIDKGLYMAILDTTFSLYKKPGYLKDRFFYNALRMGGGDLQPNTVVGM